MNQCLQGAERLEIPLFLQHHARCTTSPSQHLTSAQSAAMSVRRSRADSLLENREPRLRRLGSKLSSSILLAFPGSARSSTAVPHLPRKAHRGLCGGKHRSPLKALLTLPSRVLVASTFAIAILLAGCSNKTAANSNATPAPQPDGRRAELSRCPKLRVGGILKIQYRIAPGFICNRCYCENGVARRR